MKEVATHFFTALISAFTTWLVTRRKTNADIMKAEVDTVASVIEIWKELNAELQKGIDELQQKYDVLHEEVKKLRQENATLKRELKKA